MFDARLVLVANAMTVAAVFAFAVFLIVQTRPSYQSGLTEDPVEETHWDVELHGNVTFSCPFDVPTGAADGYVPYAVLWKKKSSVSEWYQVSGGGPNMRLKTFSSISTLAFGLKLAINTEPVHLQID